MTSLNGRPIADGHIESILIGVDKVKLSFQTWNLKQITIVFNNVIEIVCRQCVNEDITNVMLQDLDNGKECIFTSNSDNSILKIVASEITTFECGEATDINSALFDIHEHEYIKGQTNPYFF